MDEAWRRVKQELADREKPMYWLADKLGWPHQRVYNWQARQQVPRSAYLEVASVLGKSPNWLSGIDDEGADQLSPWAREIVRAFDAIENDAAQMSAFVKIIEICAFARASGERAAPRVAAPAPKPTRAPSRGK